MEDPDGWQGTVVGVWGELGEERASTFLVGEEEEEEPGFSGACGTELSATTAATAMLREGSGREIVTLL
jgi:hypothetical protein